MCDCQILLKISVFWLSEAKNEAKEVFCEARGGGATTPPSFKLDFHQNGIMRADKNGTGPEKMERARETSTYMFSGITRIIFV